jgi:hypothetical protein
MHVVMVREDFDTGDTELAIFSPIGLSWNPRRAADLAWIESTL